MGRSWVTILDPAHPEQLCYVDNLQVLDIGHPSNRANICRPVERT